MDYTPQEWRNGDTETPLSAARLTHIENGIAEHTHTIANVTGLQAALDGKQASGSYATAAALADLVARVEALETPEA